MVKALMKKLIYKMLGSMLSIRTISYESSVTIAATSYTTITVNLNVSGYTPLAVMSLASYGTEVFSLGNVTIPSSGQARVMLWNNYSDSRTASAVSFKVLYKKA